MDTYITGTVIKRLREERGMTQAELAEHTGLTFVEYVRHYRVQLAAIDILNGKTVTEVSLEYGYEFLGGFNKAFLKEYG